MGLENYKIVLYKREDGSWVAEIPAISRCTALSPIREQALEELNGAFQMISEEYREKGLALPC
jgi:predicted RNase H-like HicB family nuclease